MSYSTHLYSVDLDAVTSAIGSRDNSLLKRIASAGKPDGTKRSASQAASEPRVRVSYRGELVFNGAPVTTEDLRKGLQRSAWAGKTLYVYEEDPPRGKRREGEFREPGSFFRFLYSLKRSRYSGISGLTRSGFEELEGPAARLTQEGALTELILAKPSQPENGHLYGYALELLCRTLGTFLGAVGTDSLRSLELKTPLSRKRSPVKLPKIEDFPVISYLDANGVQSEVERLRKIDLAFPDRDIEKERRTLLKHLEAAVRKGRGVVGFYY